MSDYELDKSLGINPIGHAFQAEHSGKRKKEKPLPPIPLQDQITLRDFRDGVKDAVVHYEEQWQREKASLDAAVQEAHHSKTSLPPNYWHSEHRARGLYASALQLHELLHGL